MALEDLQRFLGSRPGRRVIALESLPRFRDSRRNRRAVPPVRSFAFRKRIVPDLTAATLRLYQTASFGRLARLLLILHL